MAASAFALKEIFSSVSGAIIAGRRFSIISRLLAAILLLYAFSGKLSAQSQTFNAAGTYTVTAPAGVTSVSVQAWGAGGGGSTWDANNKLGGGGGGGAFASGNVAVTPNTNYSIVVGGGGAANTAGGNSTFNTNAIVAEGGKPGAANAVTGGIGGLAINSTGTTKFSGGTGANGGITPNYSGGGGGGAGTTAIGGNAVGSLGGAGGITGGGNGASGVTSSMNGNNGNPPGGGGSGSSRTTSGPVAGGTGAPGQVIVTWSCPTYSLTSVSVPAICLGNTASVTLNSTAAGLPAGTYIVTYTLGAPNAFSGTANMTVTTAGSGTFTTGVLANAGNTLITITQLESGSPKCISAISLGNTFTITVNTKPTVTNAPLTQTICSGTATSLVTLTSGVAGTTFAWTATATPGVSGFTASGTSTIPVQTISTTATTQGTVTYTITPSVSGCSGTVATYTVLVNPRPNVSNSPLSQTVCSGANTSLVTLTSAVSGASFNWTATATAGVSGFTASGSGNIPVQSISTTGSTPGTVTYAVTPTAAGCAGAVTNYVITVNHVTTVSKPPDQSLCAGTATSAVTFTGTGTSYKWTNNNTSIGLAASGTGNISSFTAVNPGNTPVTATVTVTPVYSGGGANCDGTPQSFSITVNPAPTALATPAAQQVCPGSSIAQIDITNPNNVAGTTYSWTRNNTVILTGIAASGTNAAITGTLNSSSPGTMQTTTFSVTASAGGCSSQTTATVNVGDNVAPILTCPGNINAFTSSASCMEPVATPNPVYSDNCATNTLTWALSGATTGNSSASGINNLGTYTFNTGVTTVTYTATDLAGLTATCRFTVTLTDNDNPTITCPSAVTVNTNTGCTATGVNLGTPVTFDNCGVSSVTNNAPAAFPLGITTVKWTVTDGGGNSATCNQTVTVLDNTPPVKPVIPLLAAQCSVTPVAPTTTDNCSGTVTGTTTATFPITAQGLTTITWTFTDGSGNSVTADQIIDINDNVSPVWTSPAFFTTSVNISCEVDPLPAVTGTPAATDNCSTPVITYSDAIVAGGCPGQFTINRTWTATDARGNVRNSVQTIYVNDNIKPVLTCRDTTVVNPDAIFPPFPPRAISFTDNCGIDTVMLYDESFTFDANGGAGFCPKTVVRKYIVYDRCGNFSNTCSQTIFVSTPGSCEACQDTVPYFLADLNHHPDSTWILQGKDVPKRIGQCCAKVEPNPSWSCISFNVYLDKDAVGIMMQIEKPAPTGVEYYRIDCGDPVSLNKVICLAGGKFYTLTFCKPGDDRPNYIIQSISGAVTPDSLTTRADVKCSGQLHVSGLIPSSINWSVKYPPNSNSLLHYLDTTDIENPTFNPDSITPSLIIYQVCGTLLGAPQCSGTPMTDCADIIVSTLPPIRVNLDVDLTAICENDIPLITAQVPNEDPAYTYVFQWYNGPDGTGTLVGTGRTYQPTAVGSYSVRVTETTSGIGCSEDISNFNISYDLVGPVLLVPPDTLMLECNTANADVLINAWLNTARAYEQLDPTANIQVFHDYIPFVPSCGLDYIVHFWAEDVCSNRTIDSAVIRIIDDLPPVIFPQASNASSNCSTLNPDTDPGYLAWLAANGGASATDVCDSWLDWTNNSATQNWSGNPASNQITITFTVTDDCGNSAQTTATYSIIDNIPPTMTCPGDVQETAGLNNCFKNLATPADPVPADDCSVPVLTYVLSGATVGSGTGSVTGVSFNVGTTMVNYTATDAAGLTATCTFDVTIIDVNPPVFTAGCPANILNAVADPGVCSANVTVPVPAVNDPCNEGYTLVNSFTGTGNASGNYPVGTTTVTWTITDASGNVTTCEQLITVADTQVPTITCPADQEELITNGGCSKTNVTITNPTYNDNCQVTTLTWTMTGATTAASPLTGINFVTGQTFNVGITTITYTASDAAGNTATCDFDVWTKNLVAPQFQATCPGNVSATSGALNCEALVNVPAPDILNPCNELYTITNNSPYGDGLGSATGTYPVGTTNVRWIITDASGNVTTCDQDVTVTDNTPPSLTCPADAIDLITNGGCSMVPGTVGRPAISDNCGIESLIYTLTGATTGSSAATGTNYADGISYNVGITTVTYLLTDVNGNTSTCAHTIWVKNLVAPQFLATCPADVSVTAAAGCSADVTVPPPGITNPCNELFTIVNDSPYGNGLGSASGTYPVGTTTVHWIITDASANVTTCDQDVTVTDDVLPTLTCPADAIDLITNGGCSMLPGTIGRPVINDNCGIASLTYTLTGATAGSSPLTGTNYADGIVYNVGITTVTYVLTDVNGNTSSCAHTVWVKNLVAPQFEAACPADVSAVTGAASCEALVTVPVPGITNPCNELFTIVNNSPYGDGLGSATGTYPVGTTTVHWIITDASGNVTICDQDVTVTDNTPPTLTCPANAEDLITNGGCSMQPGTVGRPTYNDNCGVASLAYTLTGATTGSSAVTGINFADGLLYNIGITTVTYLLTDVNGNTSTCAHTVWVKNLAAPQFQAACPADVNVNADAGICDANISVPSPGINNPCNEAYTVTNNSPYGTDTLNNASGVYPPGTTVIHWIIIDASGNVTTCDQRITVSDTQAPVVTCPADLEEQIIDGGCAKTGVTITDPGYSDNCAVIDLTWVMSGATTGSSPLTGIHSVTGQTFNVGITTITFTARDAAGNTATCDFTVWIKNLVAPQFRADCPADVTVPADPGHCDAVVAVPGPVITNPCNEAYRISHNSPYNTTDTTKADGTYPIGTTVVHWIVTDASGNIKTCDQLITVTDLLPVLTCPRSVEENADFEKPYASGVVIGAPEYSDNCPGLTLTWVASLPTPGASGLTGINIDTVSIYNVGVTTITYTLTDAHGHSVSCSFTVTVLAKPVISCPDSLVRCNDAGQCSRSLDPGVPSLESGVQPITWTWTITGPGNTVEASGSYVSSNATPVPPPIGNQTFRVGTSVVTWIATNISGADTCTQEVTVNDCEPPVFSTPAPSFCVNNLITAIFDGVGDINPTRPDYYIFRPGDKSLDISGLTDNCCVTSDSLHWRIDFTAVPNPTPPPATVTPASISGMGQPSLHTGDLELPGDGITFSDITHSITYWITDCHGNTTDTVTVNFVVRPRPNLIKM